MSGKTMTIEDMFKQTIFVEDWIKKYGVDKAFQKQLGVVAGELFEVQEAYSQRDLPHTKEEIIDVLHSAVQLFYMTPNYQNGEAGKIIDAVRNKNLARGYYVNNC